MKFTSFDCSPKIDIKGVSLDISKAFDKVWQEGSLFRLQSYGIEGSLLRFLKNYLTAHQQSVALNGQTSLWCSNRSKILYEAGLRIVLIFGVGHSRQLCFTLDSSVQPLSHYECPTPNNRISQPEFSTPYRCVQLCIQTLFQVGHLEQNILLYGVGHSE